MRSIALHTFIFSLSAWRPGRTLITALSDREISASTGGQTEEGASSVEYAIIASLIAAVVVLSVTAVGEKTLKNLTSLVF